MLGQARVIDVARATLELGRARLRLNNRNAGILAAPPPLASTKLSAAQRALIDRVAYVMPRVAGRVPWRADCLVQASAAEHWLRGAGIATTVTLGVPKDMVADFSAHAWLSAGDRIVTGGDVSGYVPLTRRQATEAS